MTDKANQKFLGIDVGGTNVKLGLVNGDGELLEKVKYPTKELAQKGDFVKEFLTVVGAFLAKHPEVEKVGIGVPGTISKDRKSTIDLPNIPSFSHVSIIPTLESNFPNKQFFLENDANAAALGEFVFSSLELPENFIFLTLGTGVGGAAILDGNIFKGGKGNGMEVGHIFASSKNTVENLIGKKGIVEATIKLLEESHGIESKLREKGDDLVAKDVVKAAKKGDEIALQVFDKFGKVLGRCIVSSIRILDIHNILIGGGVSDTFKFIKKPMYKVINQYLPKYYTQDLRIQIASQGNNAGILGAASLCMQ